MNARIDVRHILPSIHVPALVIHVTGDRIAQVEEGNYIASKIPGAKFVELPGTDHIFIFQNMEPVVGEIQEFLTGIRGEPDADRVLATILFTDIVDSTDLASSLGDLRWRDLLDAHDRLVRRQLTRYRGREVATAGDGFLATFDGPARAIRCACSLVDEARGLGLDLRIGLHTGEVESREDNVGGIAVHIGARVGALANAGEVLVSSSIPPLVVGSGLEFEDRGKHQLKGMPDEWRLFAVKR